MSGHLAVSLRLVLERRLQALGGIVETFHTLMVLSLRGLALALVLLMDISRFYKGRLKWQRQI
jgi:hypothetical protein